MDEVRGQAEEPVVDEVPEQVEAQVVEPTEGMLKERHPTGAGEAAKGMPMVKNYELPGEKRLQFRGERPWSPKKDPFQG